MIVRRTTPKAANASLWWSQSGQQAEHRVGAAGDADGYRQHVIHHQGAAGHHAEGGGQQFAGNQVTAAAGGKLLDDLGVTRAKDDNGEHRRQRDEQTQERVLLQREKGGLGTVARRRQAIGTQPHPGKQRNQRGLMKQLCIRKISRIAEHRFFDPGRPVTHIHHDSGTPVAGRSIIVFVGVNVKAPNASGLQRIALPNAGEVS
jgi:hypothetical protein